MKGTMMTTEKSDASATAGAPIGSVDKTAATSVAPETTTTTTQTEQAAATGADASTAVSSVLGGSDTGETPKDAGADAGKEAEPKGDDKEQDPLDVVPEDGVYKLALPEGVEVDEAALAQAAPVFKELGLTHSQASKIANVFADLRAREAQEMNDAWVARNRTWVEEAKADKTYSTVGFDAAVKIANAAFVKVFSPEAIEALTSVGLGNHPAVIRDMFKLGATMANDRTERGSNGNAAPEAPLEERMYGKTTPTSRKG
jgi:antitoxin component of RelBE/YafQ-DinJ toxin-antitoxin module